MKTVLPLLLLLSLASLAQTTPNTIIDRAIAASGGDAAIKAASQSRIVMVGKKDLTPVYQSWRPDHPYPDWNYESLLLDVPSHRAALRTEARNSDGTISIWLWKILGDTAYHQNLKSMHASPQSPASAASDWEMALWHAPVLALDAIRHSQSDLKVLPSRNRNGRALDIVAYTAPAHPTLTLLFDHGTGLLAGYEYTVDYVLGPTVAQVLYKAYRDLPVLGKFPSGMQVVVDGHLHKDFDLFDARPSNTADDPWLQPFKDVPAPVGRVSTQARKPEQVSPNAYVLRNVGGYNVLLIDLGDSIAVIDAPFGNFAGNFVPSSTPSDDLGQIVREEAHKLFPGKRIGYVIPTHHHSDHFAGLGTIAEDGTVIITSAGNADLARRILRARHCNAKVQVIRGQLSLGTGDHELRIYEMTGGPHVDEMLFAYLPAPGIAFEGDIGDYVLSAKYFLRYVDEHHLKINRLYGVHNSSSAALADYDDDTPVN